MGLAHISHETEDQLELYALGRLPESRNAAVEEHLLLCASCREKLDDVENFALAMQRAIGSEPVHAPNGWLAWFRQPAHAGALAFAALALVVGLYLNPGRTQLAPLASLQLTAIRGEVPAVQPARETDVTLEDAPPGVALRAEVVDGAGDSVWSGAIEGSDRTIRLTRRLAPASYLVRLYDGTGRLLHEYGFRVRGELQ
jgi:hypothetical protein